MALPTATPASPHNPQVVGVAFVQQYYHILHSSPEVVYKFYQESSILGRPGPNGEMSQVTTLQGINEKILSFKFNSYNAEIETIDSLASYEEGVFIVVTGCLTSSDIVRRKFSQSFFLAPQDKGYFVLNDIFRFVDQGQHAESNQILANGDSVDAPEAPLSAAAELSMVQQNHFEENASPDFKGDLANNEDTDNPSENGGSEVEEEVAVVSSAQQSQFDDHPNCVLATSVVQDDGPKKSYASIVKVTRNTPPKMPSAKTKAKAKAKAAPPSTEKPSDTSANLDVASLTKAHSSNNGPVNGSSDVEGFSIYIRNLPQNITIEQVEEELKKFGPIRPGGVQVRNHKADNFCYGFVEFESLSSMQEAIKASPLYMGRYPTYIAQKRTTTRVVNGVVVSGNNGRGRFSQPRGGFRFDNFMGDDNFKGDDNLRGHDNFKGNGNFRGNDNFRGRDNFRGNDYFRGDDNFGGSDNFRRNDNFRGTDNFRGDDYSRGNDGYRWNDNTNSRGNDSFRGRGGSVRGNNQGYGRTDFRNHGEYSGRGQGRGPSGNYRGGYQQRPIQNGNGRMEATAAT